jgi:hypothetical protein
LAKRRRKTEKVSKKKCLIEKELGRCGWKGWNVGIYSEKKPKKKKTEPTHLSFENTIWRDCCETKQTTIMQQKLKDILGETDYHIERNISHFWENWNEYFNSRS